MQFHEKLFLISRVFCLNFLNFLARCDRIEYYADYLFFPFPIDLPKISSKIDNVETVEQSVKQTYQEDHNPWDKVISKRQGLLDRLLPFRRKKPKPHPPREVRPKRKPDQKIPRYLAKY